MKTLVNPASAHQPLLISEELSYFLPKMLPMNDTRILGSTVPFLFCSGLASSGWQDNANNKAV